MKLIKIRLVNFRQFYGDQTLTISRDDTKNVTLIHAENGVGKTTILNSVLWCFYGEVTAKFERKDQILNFQSVAEGHPSATVEVSFEHDGTAYMAQRVHRPKSRPDNTFTAFKIVNGTYIELLAPDTFIRSVVPQDMAKYFFFDGEHAEVFASETNFKKVGQAIRSMLGCDLAETAIEDLNHAVKEFNRLIGSLPGATDLAAIEERLSDLTDQQTRLKSERDDLCTDAEALQDQIDAIERSLREAEGARQIQQQRDEKVAQFKGVQDRVAGAEQAIVRWVGSKAAPVVSRKLTDETLEFIDEESLKGKIPSPYNEEFVRGLLKAERCICERDIKPESPEWRAVTKLLGDAASAVLMGRVVRARSRIGVLRDQRTDAPRVLEAEQARLAAAIDERRQLEQAIGELGAKIKDLPIEEISRREAVRQEKVRELSKTQQRKGAVELRLRQLERDIKVVQEELTREATKEKKAKPLLIRRELADKGANLLEAYLEEHERDARREIAELINTFLERTARRDYRFQFRDDFSMELTFANGQPVPKSGGENQLMSLAFIASLVQFSIRRAGAGTNHEVLIPGTVAPLVLDSPFGQLDEKYRRDTAAFVPKTASQVVLLVSSSQGAAAVLDAIRPHIGLEYVLISENKGERGTKSSDEIVVNGRKIVTSVFNSPRTQTRIEEVANYENVEV